MRKKNPRAVSTAKPSGGDGTHASHLQAARKAFAALPPRAAARFYEQAWSKMLRPSGTGPQSTGAGSLAAALILRLQKPQSAAMRRTLRRQLLKALRRLGEGRNPSRHNGPSPNCETIHQSLSKLSPGSSSRKA